MHDYTIEFNMKWRQNQCGGSMVALQAILLAIRHKVGGRLPALPNRPRHQAVVVSKVENN